MLPILQFNKPYIAAGDMSQSSGLSTGAIDLTNVSGYAVHAVWSGSPTGTLTLNGSNDGVNWTQIATQAVSGSSGSWLNNQSQVNYVYSEVTYTYSSGSGSLTVTVSGKRNS